MNCDETKLIFHLELPNGIELNREKYNDEMRPYTKTSSYQGCGAVVWLLGRGSRGHLALNEAIMSTISLPTPAKKIHKENIFLHSFATEEI